MRVRVTQLDGKLPNLALMRLAAWHKGEGHEVAWEFGTTKKPHEPDYDIVYGSAIFSTSTKAVAKFKETFPHAIVGGSGGDMTLRVEQIVPSQFTIYDYSGYPEFNASIGYAMRGCRFKCGFCIVPGQEGAARSADPIATIWRGDPYPKQLHLLDNDFFGNPEWRERVDEIIRGKFKVCLNQGINARLLSGDAWNVPKKAQTPEVLAAAERLADEQCSAIVRMVPRDDRFEKRRLYCAWDNLGDESIFFRGIDRLEAAGWKSRWVLAYMLVGYDPRETFERVEYRFEKMRARKILPYPMVHNRFRDTDPERWKQLKRFQRWAIAGYSRIIPFSDYDPAFRNRVLKTRKTTTDLLRWALAA